METAAQISPAADIGESSTLHIVLGHSLLVLMMQMMPYIVLSDCMRDHIPLLGLQSTIGHRFEAHVSTVVECSLERKGEREGEKGRL